MRPDNVQPPHRNVTPQPLNRDGANLQTLDRETLQKQQHAAAGMLRDQIDTIYQSDDSQFETVSAEPTSAATPTTPVQQQSPAGHQSSPYDRTHTARTSIQEDQWKHYHSAWQDYYQKYYEGYYTHQVAQAKQAIAAQQPSVATSSAPLDTGDESTSKKAALHELRASLLEKVESSAKKIRRSRHFMPIAAAVVVMAVFGFMQYNQVLVSNVKAYITPGSIDPQNIIVDPTTSVSVGPESRLIIPKINVDAPVFYDIPTDLNSQNKAMENGVAHFPIPGANSHPGEVGNTVLSGHSSNDVFAAGDYKYIFMQLDKLEKGDTIYANYKGTRYTYVITNKEVVNPDEVNKLVYQTDKPVMTLITCTPLGTALQRLLVTAEQVSPDPAKATTTEQPSENESTVTSMPSQGEPTILERLFGR